MGEISASAIGVHTLSRLQIAVEMRAFPCYDVPYICFHSSDFPRLSIVQFPGTGALQQCYADFRSRGGVGHTQCANPVPGTEAWTESNLGHLKHQRLDIRDACLEYSSFNSSRYFRDDGHKRKTLSWALFLRLQRHHLQQK